MTALATHVASCGRNEDRLLVDVAGDRTLLVVADGAGGMINAASVAQLICERVRARFLLSEVSDWVAELRDLDAAVSASTLGGCATVVVIEILAGTLVGASVGDSEAWLLAPAQVHDLTMHQNRKPLLGSARARPVAFGPLPISGRLLVATDGLPARPGHKYRTA